MVCFLAILCYCVQDVLGYSISLNILYNRIQVYCTPTAGVIQVYTGILYTYYRCNTSVYRYTVHLLQV
jgi:hypothetical protein